jgi:hypothetical protein
MVCKLTRTRGPFLSILLWGNLLVGVSQAKGVTKAIRFINYLGNLFPQTGIKLDQYSSLIDKLIKRCPFLLIAGKQACLIRGLLLYFFGKRNGLNIKLCFGSKQTNRGFDTHCWIVCDGRILYEVDKVIKQYTTLVEYA